MGRASKNDELKQVVTISSIFSSIVDDATTYPLLDAFTYKAACVRASGKRFETGGIATGLSVIGESNDLGICLHAGPHQIRFLNQLGGHLLSKNSNSNLASTVEEKVRRQRLKLIRLAHYNSPQTT